MFKFDNITISGGIVVGTTTLIYNLKPYLKPEGWKFKSSGEFVRKFLNTKKEENLPLSSLVSDDFDRQIEVNVRKILNREKKWVIEGWLAGFICREFKNVLRVLLICSDESIRIDRLTNRENISVNQAKRDLKLREEVNFKKWKRLYGNYNFFDPQYYNLVIDTYSSGPLETTGKVLDRLGYKNNKTV